MEWFHQQSSQRSVRWGGGGGGGRGTKVVQRANCWSCLIGRWVAGVALGGRSLPALYWLLQAHLTSCGDDGQPVVHVVADQVAHALKAVVFGSHLRQEEQGEEEKRRRRRLKRRRKRRRRRRGRSIRQGAVCFIQMKSDLCREERVWWWAAQRGTQLRLTTSSSVIASVPVLGTCGLEERLFFLSISLLLYIL